MSVMENLLCYLLYALFGHKVTGVHTNVVNGSSFFKVKLWVIAFEDSVFITLDEKDVLLIRSIFEKRYEWLSDDEIARYKVIFDICK